VKSPLVFMFSGQGSQYYGMGKELYWQDPVFRSWMTKLDDIVLQNTGLSIVDEIYHAKKGISNSFDQIIYTHPAIFMVEYSLARVLIENGLEPDYVLGASLGEFTAAAVAGVVSIEEALQVILKQVEFLSKHCQTGSMIAVIHNPSLFHLSTEISQDSELAAVNFDSHFVISGNREGLLKIENYLKTEEIFFQTLPVNYGFHSKNVAPIENQYKEYLGNYSWMECKIPIISCMLNDTITTIPPSHFWDVIRKPIQFQKTILELENHNDFNYIDLGPFSTLANFVKQNLAKGSNSQCFSIMTPFHQDLKNCTQIKNLFRK
jgi:bacillaene synthase trans-acting acyltransferase